MTLENTGPSLKQCSACHRWFEKSQFPPGRAQCVKCYRIRLSNSVWKSKLKHEYHLTPEMHEIIYRDQDGRCYFCSIKKPRRGRSGLVIDHIKVDGKPIVRGLLCRTCNYNFIDEYSKLPEECKDYPRANAYLRRGETGDYIASIRQRLAGAD